MSLPKPYYEDALCQLFLGDCRDLAPGLAGVGAVVSDPPYGIAYHHSGGGGGKHNRRNTVAVRYDDEPFSPAPWLAYPRVLLWGCDHWPATPPDGTVLCWDKSLGVGPDDSFADAEFAWCNWAEKRNVCRYLWKGICTVKAGEDCARRYHPTQKPVGLMLWCLQKLPPGLLILDPYMGSGTTMVAAKRLGLRCIGIELDAGYCRVAARRLANTATQPALLDAPPAPAGPAAAELFTPERKDDTRG